MTWSRPVAGQGVAGGAGLGGAAGARRMAPAIAPAQAPPSAIASNRDQRDQGSAESADTVHLILHPHPGGRGVSRFTPAKTRIIPNTQVRLSSHDRCVRWLCRPAHWPIW